MKKKFDSKFDKNKIRGYFSKNKYRRSGGTADIKNKNTWAYVSDGLPVSNNGIISNNFLSEPEWEVKNKPRRVKEK